jgi:hypothetical protein
MEIHNVWKENRRTGYLEKFMKCKRIIVWKSSEMGRTDCLKKLLETGKNDWLLKRSETGRAYFLEKKSDMGILTARKEIRIVYLIILLHIRFLHVHLITFSNRWTKSFVILSLWLFLGHIISLFNNYSCSSHYYLKALI